MNGTPCLTALMHAALLLLLAAKGLGSIPTTGYYQRLDMFLNDSYRGRTQWTWNTQIQTMLLHNLEMTNKNTNSHWSGRKQYDGNM